MLNTQPPPCASSVRAKRSINLLALALIISSIFHALIVFFLSPTPASTTSSPNRPLIVSIAPLAASPPAMTSSPNTKSTIAALKSPHLSQPSTPSPSYSVPVSADKYYEVHELNTAPKPLARIEPIFPPDALESGITGVVRLEMFVDEKGEVELLRVIDSTTPGIFDQAAIDAFAHQKFKPGIKDNAPVKSHLKLVIKFGENLDSDNQ